MALVAVPGAEAALPGLLFGELTGSAPSLCFGGGGGGVGLGSRQRRCPTVSHVTLPRQRDWVPTSGHLVSQPRRPLTIPDPLCGIPSGCWFFTGPRTVTRSSLRMLRRFVAFCWLLRPVLLLVSFPHLWSPVVGVPGLCWMWQDLPFVRQRRPVVGVLGLCWLLRGSFDCFWCPHSSVLRLSTQRASLPHHGAGGWEIPPGLPVCVGRARPKGGGGCAN